MLNTKTWKGGIQSSSRPGHHQTSARHWLHLGKVLHQQHKKTVNRGVCVNSFSYFKIKLRDQDKAWVPHEVCTSCVEILWSWSHGKDKHLPFGITMIWREQINHVADLYFCIVNVKGFSKKNKHRLQYPNFNSDLRPVCEHDLLFASKKDCEHDLYCCLLPRCEALRTCRSVFPIATKWCCNQDVEVVSSSAFTQRTCDRCGSL